MRHGQNVARFGSPGSGKTEATARDIVESDGAEVDVDPHEDSLARRVLPHIRGNVLFACLSDLLHSIGFVLLMKPRHNDPQESQRRGEAFVKLLLRRREGDGIANTPLMEEWVWAAIMLFLFQATEKPLSWLPYAFLPGTKKFAALVRDCTLPDIRHKFRQLKRLNPRALRAEVGSAMRLINAVFRSPEFVAWSRGGFDLGGFLENKGKLIIERGKKIGTDTMRTIMGAIILLVIDYAERRTHSLPTIRVRIDEAFNAGLATKTELQAAAEHNKRGLYFEMNFQRLDMPVEDLQLFHRHEWFRCSSYELARKAATDVVAGLSGSDETRAQRIATITDEIMNLNPGWRWVRDKFGSRKEYVPLLENPWPDWPGLREAKMQEKLEWIYSRTEYHVADAPPSSSSSPPATPRSTSSDESSSPAKRLVELRKKRGEKKPADGSRSSDGASS